MRGPPVTLTATFSFAMCNACWPSAEGVKPGLNQMLELRQGMLNPKSYGYTPRNDLRDLYLTRSGKGQMGAALMLFFGYSR